MAAVNWYSQPGAVLDEPWQWQAPLWTCSRPGEHHASDPRAGLRPVHGLRQLRRQQAEQLLVVDPAGGKRVVEGAVATGELRFQAQLHQRRHGVIGAQDRVGQLEQGVRPPVQALIQRLPEPAQTLQRPVARHRVRDDRRVRRAAGR